MADNITSQRQSVAGILAIVFGFTGVLLFWVHPLGLLIAGVGFLSSLAGLGLHFAEGGRPFRQSLTGFFIALLAVVLISAINLPFRQPWEFLP